MSVIQPSTRRVPNETVLLTLGRTGVLLVILGVIGMGYWGVFMFLNAPTPPVGYTVDGTPIYEQPAVSWKLAALSIVLGLLIATVCYNRLRYWHRYVASGVVDDKDIVHYNEYFVDYVVYVKGLTRAGNTRVYGHALSHGRYERWKIGDTITFV